MMTLGSIQTPDCKTLDNMDKNLVDWYSCNLISRKDKQQSISKTVVADAFFSKETFVTPMCENGFHVISRFDRAATLTVVEPISIPTWRTGFINSLPKNPEVAKRSKGMGGNRS